MKKAITITIEKENLRYIDELANINDRTRSNMIDIIIKEYQDKDKEDSADG